MQFPLSINDIGLWLAVMAIVLLTTSELLTSTSTYSRNITIDKKQLRLAALALGIGFMATVVLRIFQTI
jgi:hypothetical protein